MKLSMMRVSQMKSAAWGVTSPIHMLNQPASQAGWPCAALCR